MTTQIRILSAAIAAFFLAASAFAAQGGAQQKQQKAGQQQQQQAGQQDLISSDWLIGKSVYSPQAEELGNISNIIMEKRSGNAGYVVVSTGGFFDIGDEQYIVPYKALNVTGERVTLNMDKERLAQAPEWRQGLTVEEYNRQAEQFYGVSPIWDETGDGIFESEQEGIIEDPGL